MDFSKMSQEELEEHQRYLMQEKRLLEAAIADLEKEYKDCQFYIQKQCDHEYDYVDSHESWCRKCGDVWHR